MTTRAIEDYFVDPDLLPGVIPEFRARPSQVDIARFMHSRLDSHVHCAVEAPTGSGKTMAYLVPALMLGRRVIVSTKTKALMNQVLHKDIATARQVLGRELSVKKLLGRKNYLCKRKLFSVLYPRANLYPDVLGWFSDVMEDTVIEVPVGRFSRDVVEMMTADSFECRGARCGYYAECAFYRAREDANNADIVVTNHHLLLSDIALKANGPHGSVFDFADHVIFDEAHAIVDIFPGYAGSELSLSGLYAHAVDSLPMVAPHRAEAVETAWQALEERLPRGRGEFSDIESYAARFIDAVADVMEHVDDDEAVETFNRMADRAMPIFGDAEGVRVVDSPESAAAVARFIPFDAGEAFRSGLAQLCSSACFISATLSVKGSFTYFLNELGFDEGEVEHAVAGGGFFDQGKGTLLVPSFSDVGSAERVGQTYARLVDAVKGSVLIICNSIKRMREIHELLAEHSGKRVLSQSEYRVGIMDGTDTVLVGCATFREGLDLAGTGVNMVILDRLPFEYPDDLLLSGRANRIRRQGGSPFMDFFLPRAVLFFKQAAGRLLRHEDDCGVWVVMDRRIKTKSYGKYFRDVLQKVLMTENIEEALGFLEGCDGRTQA